MRWPWQKRRVHRELFLVSEKLPEALRELGMALGIRFSEAEIDRVLRDAGTNQVNAKSYQFFHADGVDVKGIVDEYEPETIWIEVEGTRRAVTLYRQFIDSGFFIESVRCTWLQPDQR